MSKSSSRRTWISRKTTKQQRKRKAKKEATEKQQQEQASGEATDEAAEKDEEDEETEQNEKEPHGISSKNALLFEKIRFETMFKAEDTWAAGADVRTTVTPAVIQRGWSVRRCKH